MTRIFRKLGMCFGAALATMFFAMMTGPVNSANAKQAYKSPDLSDLPYSAAVRAGDTVYVSGVTGHIRGSTEPVPGGVKAEADQALSHIKEILELAGSSMDRVAKCTVLLAKLDGFPDLNAAYRNAFPKDAPARSTIIVPALPNGSLVEIECNALAAN